MCLKILNIKLSVILVLILGNCSICSCAQNGDDTMNNAKLTFGPETLDGLKSNPDYIAAYGSIPKFSNSEERQQWLDKLDNLYQGTNPEMSKYMYPDGPVTAYGYTIDGVFQVGVNRTVEKQFMDEIYIIIDSKASLIGINDVPVVFVRQGLAVPVAEVIPVAKTADTPVSGEKDSVELSNLGINKSESNSERNTENKNSGENKTGKTNNAPGFGLLGSLICLFVGWKLRKS